MINPTKKSENGGPPAPGEGKGRRARDRGEVRLVIFEIDPILNDALENFRQRDRRTKRSVVTMAIEEFLTLRHAWPPKSAQDS